MSSALSRREMLHGLLATGVVMGAGWPLPALAQGEEVVPFLDFPEDFNPSPQPGVRFFDTRTLQSFLTPNDQFFTIQHYNVPEIDPASYRLRLTGLVNRPLELSLADLRGRPRIEHVVGFECSGNSGARGNPLVGNAQWAGTSLAAVLADAGVRDEAREVVFWGADKGTEEVAHGGAPTEVEQHFGRSLSILDARNDDILLAYEMNGVPLPQAQGAPLRLVVPGWYGVAQVKWLDHIHLQDARFMGRYMARDYVTLRPDQVGGETVWNETSVSRIRLKSAIARVTRTGGRLKALGFALTDGTALRTIEVSVDDGPWRAATLDPSNTRYSWKLFTYEWDGARPGEHTIVSRATDERGAVQPAGADVDTKKTRWENNGLNVRRIMVS